MTYLLWTELEQPFCSSIGVVIISAERVLMNYVESTTSNRRYVFIKIEGLDAQSIASIIMPFVSVIWERGVGEKNTGEDYFQTRLN